MILFHSEACKYCQMLIETVKRYDASGDVKLVSINALRAAGRAIPPQIHSVPALMLMPSRQMMYGKEVLDYLVMPNRGVLFTKKGPAPPAAPQQQQQLEPASFALKGPSGLSDAFAFIDETGTGGLDDRGYGWTNINAPGEMSAADLNMGALSVDTRSKKGLPDIESFRAARERDLYGDKEPPSRANGPPPPEPAR